MKGITSSLELLRNLVRDMHVLERLGENQAIEIWNKFVREKIRSRDLGLNPGFYSFYIRLPEFTPYYLILSEKGSTVALFPVVRDRQKFCSLPHLSYGGIYTTTSNEGNIDSGRLIPWMISLLKEESPPAGFYQCEIGKLLKRDENGQIEMEIRNRQPLFGQEETEKTVQMINLRGHEEDFLALLSSNVRRKIASARKKGVVVRKGGGELVADFTRVYNRNIQRLGSPTLGKHFFSFLTEIGNLNPELFVAYLDGRAVGGGFAMSYAGFYENTWFATLQSFNRFYISYLLHAEMIKSAIEKKADIYSLGRSTQGGGVHQYKLQWPVSEVPVYFSNNRQKKFRLKDQQWLTEIWKILPHVIADGLGPYFARKVY